jgi:hypothetical protein
VRDSSGVGLGLSGFGRRLGRRQLLGEVPEGAVKAPSGWNRDGRGTPAADDDRILRVRP